MSLAAAQLDALARAKTGPARVATDIWVLVGRNLRKLARTPRFLAFSLALPVIQMLIFAYVLGGIARVPGTSYREFVLPAVILQALAFSAMGSAVAVAHDMTSGLIDRFRSLPTARSTYGVARTAADAVRLLGVAVVLVGVAMAIGFRFHQGVLAAIGMVATLWWLAVAFDAVGTWLGTIFDPESAQAVAFIPILPVLFVSSAYAPVGALPGWMQPVARDNPVTAAINLARALGIGGAAHTWLLPFLAWTTGIFLVSTALGARRYERR
jgi:ABC-2 type transport system permease protein/oleandomycin transport system permease protein